MMTTTDPATLPATPNLTARGSPAASPWPQASTPTGAGRSPFVPLLLGLVAVLGVLAMQCVLLLLERRTLSDAHAAQQLAVDNATKLRSALDTLAADTQRLADAGNPNAGLLVNELRQRGITINTNPPAARPDLPASR